MTVSAEVAAARAAGLAQRAGQQARSALPTIGGGEPSDERRRYQAFDSEIRSATEERDGKEFFRVEGYASITDRAYRMWDIFGEYDERIAGRAFDQTLSEKPDVAFLVNHRDTTMARTTNGTLELSVDSLGLRSTAWLNKARQDVRDLVSAIEDQLITEMSFAFTIEDAEWSDDFTTYEIQRVDLNRGDVSAVNYGANPYTSIAARSREILQDLRHIPAEAARVMVSELSQREDLQPAAVVRESNLPGRSLDQLEAWIAAAR
jgi:HK97 family phage prohead protease